MDKVHKETCGLHCLQVKDLTVVRGGRTILKNVELHAHCGELTAIIGRNGAGKSTLMKAIVGEWKYSGSVTFSGHGGVPTPHKPRVGYVPQTLGIDKSSPATVKDMLLCYTSRLPVFLGCRRQTIAMLQDHLASFGAEHLLSSRIGDLSGGELQRVLLALATLQKPDLILLDEPVSGIDNEGLCAFYDMIDHLRERDLLVVLISHDLPFVRTYADRVVLLEDGRVAASGKPSTVFESDAFQKAFPVEAGKEASQWT